MQFAAHIAHSCCFVFEFTNHATAAVDQSLVVLVVLRQHNLRSRCIHVCVCVREKVRERERARERESKRERARERESKRERARERQQERGSKRERARERGREREIGRERGGEREITDVFECDVIDVCSASEVTCMSADLKSLSHVA